MPILPTSKQSWEDFRNRKFLSQFGKRFLDVSPGTKNLLRKFVQRKQLGGGSANDTPSIFSGNCKIANENSGRQSVPEELAEILKLMETHEVQKQPFFLKIYSKLCKRQEIRCFLLVLVLILYTIFGAFLFQIVENHAHHDTDKIGQNHQSFFDEYTPERIYKNFTDSVLDEYNWKPLGAAFYAMSIYTTIGYGNIVCKTDLGKLFTIFYAVFGIPLMVTVLNEMGKLICGWAVNLWHFWLKVCNKFGLLPRFLSTADSKDARNSDGNNNFPLILVLCSLICYLLLCAKLFQLWEPQLRDSYLDAFYFVFISMSTIGFGDLVAEKPSHAMAGFIFFLVGLTLVSMFVQLMNTKLEEQYLAALELLEAAYLGKRSKKLASGKGNKQVSGALKGVFAQQVAFGFIINKSTGDVPEAEEKSSESEVSELSSQTE